MALSTVTGIGIASGTGVTLGRTGTGNGAVAPIACGLGMEVDGEDDLLCFFHLVRLRLCILVSFLIFLIFYLHSTLSFASCRTFFLDFSLSFFHVSVSSSVWL